jgi:hypothetical protein
MALLKVFIVLLSEKSSLAKIDFLGIKFKKGNRFENFPNIRLRKNNNRIKLVLGIE